MVFILGYNIESFKLSSHKVTSNKLNIEMKGKGKKIPLEQRGEYLKRQQMLEAQAEMERNRPKGVPMFKVRFT
jgi:hypothetical protein